MFLGPGQGRSIGSMLASVSAWWTPPRRLAEELGVNGLATRDVRHFSAVRLRGGKRFELLVQPEQAGATW